MDIDEVRRANIRLLEAEAGSAAKAADRVGLSYAGYVNYRNGARHSETGKRRGMRKETAWRFEDAFGKPRGWLDQPHDTAYDLPAADRAFVQRVEEMVATYAVAPATREIILTILASQPPRPQEDGDQAKAA